MTSAPTPLSQPAATPLNPADRVSWRERLAYGVGGMPANFAGIGLKGMAIPIYQMTLKVDPVLLGIILALPRFWDAVTGPLVGYASDRTHSRFGRRRPYIVAGALLSGLAFALVWMVPTDWNSQAQLIWLLATSLLFYTCESMWAVPYQSLGYELTPNYHERTSVMGVQSFFVQLCGFSYQWVFPAAQLAIFGSVMHGVRWVAGGVALIIFAGMGMVPGLWVRERFAVPGRTRMRPGFWAGYATVLRNRGLMVLIVLVLLAQIAGVLASGIDYYVLVYYVCGGDIAQGSIWKAIMSSAYAVVALLSIGGVAWLSRRFDKRNTLMGIYALVVLGGVAKWFLFRAGVPWLCVLDPILCSPIYIASGMIAQSMVADICDEDELQHGERREGLFGAMYSWVGKVATSLSLLGTGVALSLAGFDAGKNAHQDPHALFALRITLVLATVVPALLAMGVLRFYPLNQQRAAEIRRAIEARRGAL